MNCWLHRYAIPLPTLVRPGLEPIELSMYEGEILDMTFAHDVVTFVVAVPVEGARVVSRFFAVRRLLQAIDMDAHEYIGAFQEPSPYFVFEVRS